MGGCPFRNSCYWYMVMPEDSIFREDCDEHWEECFVLSVCRDSKDFRECSKCLLNAPFYKLYSDETIRFCREAGRVA